jgi:hypothetical protein
MAITNAGSRTVHRPVKGTLVMNDDSSITVNGTNADFRLGVNANHIVSVTMNGGIIEVGRDVQNNSGHATVEINGGSIVIADEWNCSNNDAGSTTISIAGTGYVETGADFDYRGGGLDKLSLSETATLAVGRDLLMNVGTVGVEINELNVSGADVLVTIARNLISNGSTRVTFAPDAALGVSPISVSGTCTLTDSGTSTAFVFANAAGTAITTRPVSAPGR